MLEKVREMVKIHTHVTCKYVPIIDELFIRLVLSRHFFFKFKIIFCVLDIERR